MDKIEQLQAHENEVRVCPNCDIHEIVGFLIAQTVTLVLQVIYHKALQIIENFFPDGDQVPQPASLSAVLTLDSAVRSLCCPD